jgi:hypothetical protein
MEVHRFSSTWALAETGDSDRLANMRAFSVAALDVLAQALSI